MINTNLVSVAAVATFRSEFEYFIRDSDVEARNLTEIAFEHLRRMIAVDPDIRAKWKKAYDDGETACERLGAVHLLSHGIFAFKVSGYDSATDLVFNDLIQDGARNIRTAARAIVLTEWKRAKDQTDANGKAETARKQTDHYARGVLGNTELTSTRYIVVVSPTQLEAIPDVRKNGITFRHINLAVDPLSPSKAAKARVK